MTGNTYSAYVDGSARPKPRGSGIGGMIYGPRNTLVGVFSRHVDTNNSNTLAEIFAVTDALNAIPPGSRVRIYNDDIGLCDKINAGTLLVWKHQTAGREDLQTAFRGLAAAVSRHEYVSACHTRQSEAENIAHVDLLARTGSLLPLAEKAMNHRRHHADSGQNRQMRRIKLELGRRDELLATLQQQLDPAPLVLG